MPRFLYQLYDRVVQPQEQFVKQRGFLNLLRDSDISSIRSKRIESRKQLLEIIERDFASLPQPSRFRQRPDFGIVLDSWKLFFHAQDETNAGKRWGQRLSALNEAAEVSLPTAATVGLAHLVQSLTEFTPNNREFLDGLDDYLNKWIGISAWSGIRGIFGQTNIAKVRICLAQLRGHYASISALAGSVSSGLYSDRKLCAAERWYDVYRRNGEAPEIQGAIALALGKVPLACACLETVLARSDIDDAFAALHLGYYGQALASLGHLRRAMKESEKAVAVSHLPATVGTRVWRARAETLSLCRDNFGAQFAIDEAEKIALRGSLVGQVRKAQMARKRMTRKMRAES
jgi:tetratricopeptide (TPR) repeat protein